MRTKSDAAAALEPILVTELKVSLFMVMSFTDLINITYGVLLFHSISTDTSFLFLP